MTSILEALRELEADRRRTEPPASVRVSDAAIEPAPSTGMLYPLVAGLSVGVLLVALGVWWFGLATTAVPEREPAAQPAPTVPPPAPPATEARLDWLHHADAPQARVDPHPAPAGDAMAERTARGAPTRAAGRADAAGPPPRRAEAVRVEAIRFASAPTDRTATLRLDGRRVTLRQGERAGGVEVQLILENGVYLARGAEVVFTGLER